MYCTQQNREETGRGLDLMRTAPTVQQQDMDELFARSLVMPEFVANDAACDPPVEWSNPYDRAKGEFEAKSLMRPDDLARRVLPAEMFEQLQEHATAGVPTDCGPPWPTEVIDQAMKMGPHTSAGTAENVALIW